MSLRTPRKKVARKISALSTFYQCNKIRRGICALIQALQIRLSNMRICCFQKHSKQLELCKRLLDCNQLMSGWVRRRKARCKYKICICMIFNITCDSRHCYIWTRAKSCPILSIIYHSFEPSRAGVGHGRFCCCGYCCKLVIENCFRLYSH